MASSPIFVGIPQSELLARVGTALLQIKTSRRLTADDMRMVFGLKGDDQVSKYIAGEAEMGVVAWMRALAAWPELEAKLAELPEERDFRARQPDLEDAIVDAGGQRGNCPKAEIRRRLLRELQALEDSE